LKKGGTHELIPTRIYLLKKKAGNAGTFPAITILNYSLIKNHAKL